MRWLLDRSSSVESSTASASTRRWRIGKKEAGRGARQKLI
jgi:hypothetical protein